MKSCTITGRSRFIRMKKSLLPIKRLLLCIDDTAKQSFPLKRIVMTINPIDRPIIPHVAVLYQTDSPITDDMRVLCHGNSNGNQTRPYIRTSKEVLSKTKNLPKEGNTCKEAYDKVNALPG